MIDLGSRIIDEQGNVVYTKDGLLEIIASGRTLPDKILTSATDEIVRFNQSATELFEDVRIENQQDLVDIKNRVNKYLVPDKYLNFDPLKYVINLCETEQEIQRTLEEHELYKQKNLLDVLKICKYIVDEFEKNNVITGVGRGSSCASFMLYKLGIHYVNPLKYDIKITEFLRS